MNDAHVIDDPAAAPGTPASASLPFRSARERAVFTCELTKAINSLVAKYHDETTQGGRCHRLVLMAHPLPQLQSPGGERSAASRRPPPPQAMEATALDVA